MANAVTRQVLVNGSRNYVIKFTITGDGSGEETGVRVNDTSGDMGTSNKIMKIDSGFAGFSGTLLFDADTDVKAVTIPEAVNFVQDYHYTGGIINNAGTGKTGDILLATAGLGSGDVGHILLYVKKK